MKKIIALALAAGAFIIPATAEASPVYECGGMPSYSITNLTTRNPNAHSRRAACIAARIFVRAWYYHDYPGVQVRYGTVGGRKDIRITSRTLPGWVVRFQQPSDLYND